MSTEELKKLLRSSFPSAWQRLATAKAGTYHKIKKRLISRGYPVFIGDVDQDRWVVEEVFGSSHRGFFLELGALNGFSGSNTYVLEKVFGWDGLCIEPSPDSFPQLRENRSCACAQECIDGVSGQEVRFVLHDGQSGIVDEDTDNSPAFRSDDLQAAENAGRIVTMRTKTLAEVLRENRAPSVIDFFSFDVEGAETRILRDFPFEEFRFLTLVIERASPELNEILRSKGYTFVTLRVGDSFYIHESVPVFENIRKDDFEQAPAKPAVLKNNYRKVGIPIPLILRSLIPFSRKPASLKN